MIAPTPKSQARVDFSFKVPLGTWAINSRRFCLADTEEEAAARRFFSLALHFLLERLFFRFSKTLQNLGLSLIVDA